MKPVLLALAGGTGMGGAFFAALQTAGETQIAVGTVAGLVGASTFGGILLYVVRRVQSIPAEEGVKRHDAIDREHATITVQGERFDGELQRLEARLMGIIDAVEDRVKEEVKAVETRQLSEIRRVESSFLREFDRVQAKGAGG